MISAPPLKLAQNQKTAYVISLAGDATAVEQTAAEQLQKYLQEVTGATFPLKKEDEVKNDTPQILVGAGTRVRTLLPRQDWGALGNDGIVIKTIGTHLILAGGRPRGTLYAVFQFLQQQVGCRWWTPDASTIPRKSTLEIPAIDLTYVPPFSYRENLTTPALDPVFAAISHQNGHFQRIAPEWGGHHQILGFVHTFTRLLPPEKYFQQHPEWYSDPANKGLPCTAASKMPSAHDTQLCLSAPGVLEELTRNALDWIKENPQAGYISISETDVAPYCQCEKCREFLQREGSQAGIIVDFVNKVAARIERQYPHFMVETLAYHGSEKPPKTVRPAHNVIIRLAPIAADYGHALDSDSNQESRENIRGWAAIAPHLFVWNYVTNFHYGMLPHPNRKHLADDLRFFATHNVKGIFEQGDNFTNNVGDFVFLRAWLLGQLMWNPQLDQDQLTDEFLRGYYGAAAPHLKEYLNVIQNSFDAQNRTLSTFNSDFSFLTLDVMNQATQCFARALDAVKGDATLTRRILREKNAVDLAWIVRYRPLKRTALQEKKPFLGPAEPLSAIQQFAQNARSFEVRNYSEGGKFEQYIPLLEQQFPPAVALPEFAQKYEESAVIDIQQNDFQLYSKGSGTAIVEDAQASDQQAARLSGKANGWLIQAPLDKIFDAGESAAWHAYALVRIQPTPGAAIEKDALQMGLYDTEENRTVKVLSLALQSVVGEQYQVIDLGQNLLHAKQYFWLASLKNPAVENIYLDRIILIRQ